MYLTQSHPYTDKLASRPIHGASLERINSSKVNNRDNIAQKVDEIYNRFTELSKDTNSTEKFILGEYNEEIKDLQEKFKDPAFKREYVDKVNAELDKELVKNSKTSTRKALISTKNFLFKTIGMPEYPPSQLISFKGERYINTIRSNASIGNDLSRLKTTTEKANFENKLKNSRVSYGNRESCWDSESSFDNSVISAMKESNDKKDKIKILIQNSTNMDNEKLEHKLQDVKDSDLIYLDSNAKTIADLNNRDKARKLLNEGILGASLILSYLGIAATNGIGPITLPALMAVAAGFNYEMLENNRKIKKQVELEKFISTDLPAHLINIKLKRLVLKGKTQVRDIYNIIKNANT